MAKDSAKRVACLERHSDLISNLPTQKGILEAKKVKEQVIRTSSEVVLA